MTPIWVLTDFGHSSTLTERYLDLQEGDGVGIEQTSVFRLGSDWMID